MGSELPVCGWPILGSAGERSSDRLCGPWWTRHSTAEKRQTGSGESPGAHRETDVPPLRRSSQRKLAGALSIGNNSKGNKAHGRTGSSGISDGAGALRTRRRSKASKVNAHPLHFGAAAAVHALKCQPGNGLARRRRWLRVLSRCASGVAGALDDELLLTVPRTGRCAGLRSRTTLAVVMTLGSSGPERVSAGWSADDRQVIWWDVSASRAGACQPGDRRGGAELPGSLHDEPGGTGSSDGFPDLALWNAVRR